MSSDSSLDMEVTSATMAAPSVEFGRLLKSTGPLDVLLIHSCNSRAYLAPFLDFPEFDGPVQPIAYPPIKEYKIRGEYLSNVW